MFSKSRTSGILMPISSLPSPHGIGAFGKDAYDFVDFLAAAGVRVWQILPLSVTSYGDSPYQSPSAVALNYYFIDLDILKSENLLTEEEIGACDFGTDPGRVDYGKLFLNRLPLLKKAYERFDKESKDFLAFEKQGTYRDFAFFMTLKARFSYRPWYEWSKDFFNWSQELEDETIEEDRDTYLFYIWTQFEFLKQYGKLKKYANDKGIVIFGDMPLYLARDSVEAYKYPELFLFDKNHQPSLVAGCPPDAFSPDGQLWGNPIYDWAQMKKDNYAWMSDRIAYNLRIFDALRIDHFRGISGYYCIPFGSPNAVNGTWKKGPGFELFKDKTSLPIVAEDLGFLDDDVKEMLKETTYPGMKILEFAFDGRKENTDKPSNYLSSNSVCYTGTHDNMPMCGYLMSLKDEELKTVEEDVRSECLLDGVAFRDGTYQELTYTIDQLCYASKAFLAVLPLQDLLALDDSARMNKPSTLSNMNWSFRVKKEDFSPELSARLKEYVLKYHR